MTNSMSRRSFPAFIVALIIALPCLAESNNLRTRLIEGVGGVPINVVEAGDPALPAIILIHGLGQSHLSWKMQLRSSLVDDFHLIAYDLRGHGNSGKPWRAEDYAAPTSWAGDLERVREATGANKPVLVAWSYGTWVAVDYLATRDPGAASGLVLIGALGGLGPTTVTSRPGDSEMGQRIRAGTTSGLLSNNFAAGADIMKFFLRGEVDDSIWLRDTGAANALLPPYARPLITQRSFDHSGALQRIDMPTLIAVGSEDPQVTPEDARSLAEHLPSAEVSVYAGSGHLLFAEDYQRFNAELRAFAKRTISSKE